MRAVLFFLSAFLTLNTALCGHVFAQDNGAIEIEALDGESAGNIVEDTDFEAESDGSQTGTFVTFDADALMDEPEIIIDTSMVDMPVVKLRSLDKTTARTMTFDARVGNTVKFGSLYIKVRACRKAPPIAAPESAAFLQIWEIDHEENAKWIFSGWMFASSPGLSAMDHVIYDVWVLDCMMDSKELNQNLNQAGEAPEEDGAAGLETEAIDASADEEAAEGTNE